MPPHQRAPGSAPSAPKARVVSGGSAPGGATAPGVQWAPEGAKQNWWEAREIRMGGSVHDALEAASTPWILDDGLGADFETRSAGWWTEQPIDVADLAGTPDAAIVLAAGLPQSAAQMLRVATAFGCVRVIGEDVGKLSRHVLRHVWPNGRDGTRRTQRALDDPRYELLATRPNEWMTGQELIEYMVGQAALHGTAYAFLNRNVDGIVEEILPILPGRCTPRQGGDWSLAYDISGYGETITRHPRDLWRLNGPMFTTLAGANIGALAREALGLARALESSQSRFHASDARPSGVLATKGTTLAKEQRENVRSQWNTAYGPGGRGGVAVLDGDWEFKTISATAVDSQVIENRAFQIEEICRYFRVHPWAIMRQASSQSYGTVEQTARAHLEHTLMPWVVRVEQTVKRDILGEPDDRDLFLKIAVDEIARSTFGDRVNAYKGAVTVYMTPNEVRIREDMDPLPDPAMDKVQLPANNTGLAPGGGGATAAPAAAGDGQRLIPDGDAGGTFPDPIPAESPRLPPPPAGDRFGSHWPEVAY